MGESWTVDEARRASHRYLEESLPQMVPGGPFTCIGTGQRISDGIAQLMRGMKRSVWNAQRSLTPRSNAAARPANKASRRRGHDMRMITTSGVLGDYPFVAAFIRPLWVGEVLQPIMILDEEVVVLAGPNRPDGVRTAWATRDSELVANGLELWSWMWPRATPVPPLDLTERQVDLVLGLAAGHTDATLARRLDISERTVSAEIARIASVLNVAGRAGIIGVATGLSSGEQDH